MRGPSRAGARFPNPIGEFLRHSGTPLFSRTKSPADLCRGAAGCRCAVSIWRPQRRIRTDRDPSGYARRLRQSEYFRMRSGLFMTLILVVWFAPLAGAQSPQECIQPSTYALLRQDEDYGYLRNPPCRQDFWDPVKFIPFDSE